MIRVVLLTLIAMLGAIPRACLSQVTFKDVTDSSGIAATNPDSYSYSSIWVDVDNDGLLDLYIAHGSGNGGEFNQLYHNLGNGKFTDIRAKAFPEALPAYTGQMSWGDFNNDGFIDCYESHFNTTDDWIWINNGNMTFRDGRDLYSQPGLYSTGAIFSDINSDGLLDLMVNTQDWEGSSVYLNNGKSFDVIHPFVNMGQGDEILSTYINDDTIPDYMFGNARGIDSLFVSIGSSGINYSAFDNTFLRNVRTISDYPGAAAFADVDNDGFPDLLVHYPNKLYLFHNINGTGFVDWTHAMGLDPAKVGFHHTIFFADFDNDGYIDLLLSNTDTVSEIYYGGPNGFTASPLPINMPPRGGLQNLSITDYDNDGFLDLQHNAIGHESLWHNEGNGNRWLTVNLKGHRANSNGIGTRVNAYLNGKPQYREVGYSQGYYGYFPLMAHFGFGPVSCGVSSDVIDSVVILWQPGGRQVLKNVQFNQTILVDQDSGIVRSFARPVATSLGYVYPFVQKGYTVPPDTVVSIPISIYLPPSIGADTIAPSELTFTISFDNTVLDVSPANVAQRYKAPPGWVYKSSLLSGDTLLITISNPNRQKLALDSNYLGTIKFDTYLGDYPTSLVVLDNFSFTEAGSVFKFCISYETGPITHVTVDTATSTMSVPIASCPVTDNVTVMPNPQTGTGQEIVEFPSLNDGTATVRVVDLLGREVYRADNVAVLVSAANAEVVIPAGVAPRTGSYIIDIQTPKQRVVGRFVVSR